MIDFILAGLSAGLVVFISLFVFSFVVLGTLSVGVHLIVVLFGRLLSRSEVNCREQAA